jgi:hypothetical protein
MLTLFLILALCCVVSYGYTVRMFNRTDKIDRYLNETISSDTIRLVYGDDIFYIIPPDKDYSNIFDILETEED